MLYELWIKLKGPLYGNRGWYRVSEHSTAEAAEHRLERMYDVIHGFSDQVSAWAVHQIDPDDGTRRIVHEEP